jgi:hypothetical protein
MIVNDGQKNAEQPSEVIDKMKLSSNDIKQLLHSAAVSARYAKVSPDSFQILEHQVRFWLRWNKTCVKKGFLGHDKDIEELNLRLRLITDYKNQLVKEELIKGF